MATQPNSPRFLFPISFISQQPRCQSHCVSYRKVWASCRHHVVEYCQVVGTYSCMNNA
jgi:hypothetical protein